MKLSKYLDTDLLERHIREHYVNVQHHRFLPLQIYNYGQKATFENVWDDVTTKCRGLIVDRTNDEIIARPFPKFFNLGTLDRPETLVENLPAELPEITEKMDGSLGILYRYNGFTGIATRGSFESEQASWASAWYDKLYKEAVWPEGKTPLFEIIYAANRIVVKYSHDGLMLLSVVDNETGEEFTHAGTAFLASLNHVPVVERHDKNLTECRHENVPNREGYVVTWRKENAPALKLKIKFEDYRRLHRLLTGISPKAIWGMLKDGESFDELTTDVPSHYRDWVESWRGALTAEYGRIEQKALAIYATCQLPKDGKDRAARKELAGYFTLPGMKDVSDVLFQLLDGQPYAENIWKKVRPMTTDLEPFKRDFE